MPVKIRLQRKGRRKRPFYHIVVADSRSPRDGRYIERIGSYNPMTSPATIEIDRDKAYEWLVKGAQPTDTARAILRFKGVYYRKHLMRGVQKGAMTMEEAEAKYEQWISEKEAKIEERRRKQEEEKKEYHKKLSGEAPALDVTVEDEAAEEEEVSETAEATAEEGAAAVDTGAEAAEEKAGDEPEAVADASEEKAGAEEAEAEEAKAEKAESEEVKAEEAEPEEVEQAAEEAEEEKK